MNTSDGALSFATAIDTSGFKRGAIQLQNIIGETGTRLSGQLGYAIDMTGILENSFKRLGAAVGIGFSIQQALSFASTIRDVRSEIQSLEISFETLLGSKEKADAMFGSIREFAVNTPMQLKDLASSAQMMLSFNIDDSKVMDYLKALGDVSMGDTQRFQSLSLAFSQMSSAGKLMGQDLMQMINAGFNPLSVISEKTGKSISELKDEMSAGKISAEMVQQAFIDATSAGGKFNNMLEKQSHGIAGAMSNLQGAIDDMFNELGQSSEETIANAYSTATEVVKHWKSVAEAVGAVIAVYGTYRAALMLNEAVANNAAKSIASAYQTEIASSQTLVAEKQAEAQTSIAVKTADIEEAVAKGNLTQAQASEVIAARQAVAAKQAMLAASVASAEAELASATAAESEAQAQLASATAVRNAAIQKELSMTAIVERYQALMIAAKESGDIEQYNWASKEMGAAMERQEAAAIEANTAAMRLNTAETNANTAAKKVANAEKSLSTAKSAQETLATQANTIAEQGNATATSFLTTAKTKLALAVQRLYATMMAHPYAILAAAVVALGYAIYKLCTYQTEAEKAQKKLNETITKSEASINAEQQAIKNEFDSLKSLEKGTKQYEAVKNSIIKQYGQYLQGLINEKNELLDIEAAYIRVANAARDAARERALTDATDMAKNTYNEQTGDKYNRIYALIQKRAGNQAEALWDIVRSEIEDGGGLSASTRKLMQSAFGIKNEKNRKFGAYDSDVQSIMEDVSAITSAQKTLSQSMQQAQAVYGDAANRFIGYTNDELSAIKQQILDYGELNDLTNAKIYLHGKEVMSINNVAEAQRALNQIAEARKQNNAESKNESSLAEDYASAQKAWQEAKKKVAKMDADRAKYTTKEYEAATAELKSAKEKFEKLGGNTSDKNKDSDTSEKLANIERRQARDRKRMQEDLELEIWQERIKAGEYGSNAYIQQRELDFKKEQIQLQRQMEDAIDAEVARQKEIWDKQEEIAEKEAKKKGISYNKRTFDSESFYGTDFKSGIALQNDKIGDVDTSTINGILQNYALLEKSLLDTQEKTRQEEIKRQAESMNEYLAQWGEHLQKRQALIDIANAKLNNPDSNLAEGEKLAIKAQLKKDLADVDKEELKKSLNWEEVFGNLNAVATASLQSMKKKLQEFIKTNKDLKPDEIKDLVEAIEKIDDKLTERDPFKALEEDFKSLKDATEKARQAQEAYNKALKEGSEQEQEQAKQAYEQALNAKQKAQADATKSLQAAAGQVSELLQMVNAVVGCIESFGVDVPEQILGFLDGMGSAVESLASIDLTRPMSIITGFAGAIGNVVKGIGSLFNNDSGHEKKIKRIQNQIDALSKSYESLADKIEEAYSKDASQLIEQQNKILEQKKALIQQQINEEKAKKKTDNDRIKEWESQIEDINKAIADNKQKALDAIFGEDLKSAIENFASAYADAWAQGENRAKSAKDTVKNMMRQMVQESIKAAIQSGGAMERIREQLQAFYADNVLSGWEQDYIYKMAESLQQELDSQFAWADSLLKDNSFQQSGSSGGFQAMSEDTGTELNGRFTAMQIAMEDIRSISDGIKTDTSLISDNVSILRSGMEEMQSIALLQLGQLEAISRNTKGIADMGETLERIERNTQKL